ncbi:MAG TPA: ATP-binding protein, partial [Blastocatellia bacterium]|nr:ATP-binding protein [Blastocatellia bacterium]
ALSNLVINAVQAIEHGGKVRIETSLEMDEPAFGSRGAASRRELPSGLIASNAEPAATSLILTVSDTGPGISEEAQQRVFEPFYSTKSRGTGLGLAIVQRRAVELGGRVELTSPIANGHGTRFRLIIPLAPIVERA